MSKIASTDHFISIVFNRTAFMMMPRITAAVFGVLAVTSLQAMAEPPATGAIPALAGNPGKPGPRYIFARRRL